jgi:hypothetical protein
MDLFLCELYSEFTLITYLLYKWIALYLFVLLVVFMGGFGLPKKISYMFGFVGFLIANAISFGINYLWLWSAMSKA